MKWAPLFFCFIMLASPVRAYFEWTEVGPRALGLGSNFVSVADDASALYWNPAGLARLPRHEAVFASQHSPDLADLQRHFAAVVLHTRPASLGMAWRTVVLDGAMREDLVYLSVARHLVRRSLGSFITAGATLKWARVGLETSGLTGIPGLRDAQSVVTGDVGLLAAPIPNVRFGVIARNLGQPQIDLVEGGDATALRSEIEWGVSLRWRQDAQLHLSQVTHPDHDTETKLGAEVDVFQALSVRLGVSEQRMAGGIGVRWSRFQLDTSYQSQGDLGASTHIGLLVRFGPTRSDLGDEFDDF
jgi:hypothetical protein